MQQHDHLYEVKRVAYLHMAKLGLLQKGWKFKYIDTKRIIGRCYYSSKTIALSKSFALVNTIKDMEQTILHECAHALVGPNHGHNNVWKSMALKIGCIDPKARNSIMNKPSGKWILFCNCCKTVLSEDIHRRKRNIQSYSHNDCGTKSRGMLYYLEKESLIDGKVG